MPTSKARTAIARSVIGAFAVLALVQVWHTTGSPLEASLAAVGTLLLWSALRRATVAWQVRHWAAATLGAFWSVAATAILLPPFFGERVELRLLWQDHVPPAQIEVAWGPAPQCTASCRATAGAAALELRATGHHAADAKGSEVWLLDSSANAADFRADAGWTRRDRVWVSASNKQPAVLRWNGTVDAPLELTFRRHDHSGEAELLWNGEPQTLDLYAAKAERFTVRLAPSTRPEVHTVVPASALQQSLVFRLAPSAFDRTSGRNPLLRELRMTGAGTTRTWSGAALAAVLHAPEGTLHPTDDGVQLEAATADRPFLLALDGNAMLADGTSWAAHPAAAWARLHALCDAALLGALLFGALAHGLRRDRLIPLLAVGWSMSLALSAGEFAIGRILPETDLYCVWPPGMRARFTPAEGVMPGISGEKHFSIDRHGLRGRDPQAGDYRILAIGGSTTECLYLDQTETWTALLETGLAAQHATWVGNAGKSGHTSREHLLMARHLLPQERPDAVVVLAGVNDFLLRLQEADAYDPNAMQSPSTLQNLMDRAFREYPRHAADRPGYEHLAIVRLLQRWQASRATTGGEQPLVVQDRCGAFMVDRRLRRQRAAMLDRLPDLTSGLHEYRANLSALVDCARRQGARVVLVTQPFLWQEHMSPDLERLLLFGESPNGYYGTAALAAGLERYNDVAREVARSQAVECVDLAQTLPKDTRAFVDDVHFNENGARLVAQALVAHFEGRAPYR